MKATPRLTATVVHKSTANSGCVEFDDAHRQTDNECCLAVDAVVETSYGGLVGLMDVHCIMLPCLWMHCMFPCVLPLDAGIILCISLFVVHPPNVGWSYNDEHSLCSVAFAWKSLYLCKRSFWGGLAGFPPMHHLVWDLGSSIPPLCPCETIANPPSDPSTSKREE